MLDGRHCFVKTDTSIDSDGYTITLPLAEVAVCVTVSKQRFKIMYYLQLSVKH